MRVPPYTRWEPNPSSTLMIPEVPEGAGGVVNGQVVDGRTVALGLHYLLVGGVLVGRVT